MRVDRINLLLASLAAVILLVDTIVLVQYLPTFAEVFDSFADGGIAIPLATQVLVYLSPWIGVVIFIPVLIAGVSIFSFNSPAAKRATTWVLGLLVFLAFCVIPLAVWILYLPLFVLAGE